MYLFTPKVLTWIQVFYFSLISSYDRVFRSLSNHRTTLTKIATFQRIFWHYIDSAFLGGFSIRHSEPFEDMKPVILWLPTHTVLLSSPWLSSAVGLTGIPIALWLGSKPQLLPVYWFKFTSQPRCGLSLSFWVCSSQHDIHEINWMFKSFQRANCLINLGFRPQITLRVSEELDFVNEFISIAAALENGDGNRESGNGSRESGCYSAWKEWLSCLSSYQEGETVG